MSIIDRKLESHHTMSFFRQSSDEDQDDNFEIIEEVTDKSKYNFDLASGFYEVTSK